MCIWSGHLGSGEEEAPVTPAAITPPPGNTAFSVGHAIGTQGYVCLPTSTGASWTVNGSRPEATLFAGSSGKGKQIGTHFLSPDTNPNPFAPKPLPFGSVTWQSSSLLPQQRVVHSVHWRQPRISDAARRALSQRPHYDVLLRHRCHPAMAMKMVGAGSQYQLAFTDSEGKPLDGSKTYKIHVPPNIPAKQFWSFVVYDNQTGSMLQTDAQFPGIGSQTEGIVSRRRGLH
jgi:Protein of unknown function (DUF1214)/Protein of unknown function (DUF3455)